jgi:hypothetical protein
MYLFGWWLWSGLGGEGYLRAALCSGSLVDGTKAVAGCIYLVDGYGISGDDKGFFYCDF